VEDERGPRRRLYRRARRRRHDGRRAALEAHRQRRRHRRAPVPVHVLRDGPRVEQQPGRRPLAAGASPCLFLPLSLSLLALMLTRLASPCRRSPNRAARPASSASTTRRATSSSSHGTSRAPTRRRPTASSRTTTGSCSRCARCTRSSRGTQKAPSSCTRAARSRRCTGSSGASTVRRPSPSLSSSARRTSLTLHLTPADNPLHTCFAWVGTGAFTSRFHVERFLALTGSGASAYGRDELAHADNSFTTMLNEPPYVLQSALAGLPSPGGHSDGEGIARNKAYIVRPSLSLARSPSFLDPARADASLARSQWQGVARLSSHLNLTFPPAPPPSSPLTALSLPPLSSPPHRLAPSPPLPAHPHAHHARAPCTPSDACTFVTNVQLLPPPDSARFPGVAAVGEGAAGLQRWEEHLGHVARGWKEGGERWSAEEDWAREWAYEGAVDGELGTVFRSPDGASLSLPRALGVDLCVGDAGWFELNIADAHLLALSPQSCARATTSRSGSSSRSTRPGRRVSRCTSSSRTPTRCSSASGLR